VDDLALPAGQVRVRTGGSAGGHKGLLDIIARLGREDFGRVRLGIGPTPPGWSGRDYVLSRPAGAERQALDQAVGEAADAIATWLQLGPQAAMNKFNRPRPNSSAEAKDPG
jgi:peptidyl-tRNA hydrolase, PTH1 family